MEVPIISITSQKEARTGMLTVNLKSLKSSLLNGSKIWRNRICSVTEVAACSMHGTLTNCGREYNIFATLSLIFIPSYTGSLKYLFSLSLLVSFPLERSAFSLPYFMHPSELGL